MKFDVVIGNPPYNNDLYLDFVQTGYNLLKDDGVMVQITPAKWQAKGGKKNEDFRANIVPHMKEIVYFENAKQVFDIGLQGGVCYYTCYKGSNFNEKTINGSKYVYDKDVPMLLYCSGQVKLLQKVKDFTNKFIYNGSFPATAFGSNINFTGDHYKEQAFCNSSEFVLCDSKCERPIRQEYVKNQHIFRQYHTLSKCPWGGLSIMFKPYHVPRQYYTTIYYGTELECIYAKSYFDSKLVRFLETIAMGGGCMSGSAYRLVPDPGQFDHIFTDDELYKKYNLTQDEINIIESVIKERK